MSTRFVAIPMQRDSGKVRDFAFVDAADAVRVIAYRWNASGGYAIGRVNGRQTPMHRFILELDPGDGFVHHVNENPLDNRRQNLEWYATASQANSQPHPKAYAAGERARLEHMRRMLERAEQRSEAAA